MWYWFYGIIDLKIFVSFFFISSYDIVPCSQNGTQISSATGAMNESTKCYGHMDSTMVGTLEWRIYSILIQTVLRLLPTIMICLLNVLMYIKLRKIQKQRNKIFGLPKESTTTTSVPGTIPFHTSFNACTLPRTFKHRVARFVTSKNEDKTFNTISEVVEKVSMLQHQPLRWNNTLI